MKVLESLKMHGLVTFCGFNLLSMIMAKWIGWNAWFAHLWKRKKTLLALKHVGHQKCKASIPNINASSCFNSKNLVHSKNEKFTTLNNKMLVTSYLFKTYISCVMLPLTTTRSMCNVLSFIAYLLTIIPWTILKASKPYSKCSKLIC